jgi:hypothetical protein
VAPLGELVPVGVPDAVDAGFAVMVLAGTGVDDEAAFAVMVLAGTGVDDEAAFAAVGVAEALRVVI